MDTVNLEKVNSWARRFRAANAAQLELYYTQQKLQNEWDDEIVEFVTADQTVLDGTGLTPASISASSDVAGDLLAVFTNEARKAVSKAS